MGTKWIFGSFCGFICKIFHDMKEKGPQIVSKLAYWIHPAHQRVYACTRELSIRYRQQS